MFTPAVKIRGEFKPLLSTLALSLEFSEILLQKKVRFTTEPHQITVENDEIRLVYELDGLTLLPASCRSLRWASDRELQLTLQIKENSKGIIKHESPSTNQDFLVSRIQSSQNLCHCVGCGAKIFKAHSHFKRVLPLPSENWSDFADIWFCHNHSHDASESQAGGGNMSCSGDGSVPEPVTKLKQFPMLPRIDDCLVSSLYMLLDSSHVRMGCVTRSSERLLCKRCGNFIGFVKDERTGNVNNSSGVVYKIYHHAVSFKDNESGSSDEGEARMGQGPAVFNCNGTQQHMEDFMTCLLKDQSQIFTSFRFILTSSLQAKEQSSISILLWLLDQELSVFSGPMSPSANKPSGSKNIKLTSNNYMKLLYKATFTTLGDTSQSRSILKTSNIFEAWRLDNTVHGISLPYPLCKQLIHLLVTSTKALTKSQRSLNGFHVGYLKVS